MNIFNIERSFRRRRRLGYNKSYWAIDVHDTIFSSDYLLGSAGGEFYPFAIEVLRELTQAEDIVMILYTSSVPSASQNAIKRCAAEGIVFDYINENPEIKSELCHFTPKFYFDVLLDDKAGFEGETDWYLVQKELRKARKTFANPVPTVDAIIFHPQENSILLIERKNTPLGWALPGGFVDYNESLEHACAREVREETGGEVVDLVQFASYSDPKRDPRQHTISTVFEVKLKDYHLKAGDDAAALKYFAVDQLPENIVFDHKQIIGDYLREKNQ